MSLYVIAHTDSNNLDSPVFYAGSDGQQEAVAIFTKRHLAEEFIVDADWQKDYSVGALEPVQVLKWFEIAREDGCDVAVINPIFAATATNSSQRVVHLDEPLEAFAESLSLTRNHLEAQDGKSGSPSITE